MERQGNNVSHEILKIPKANPGGIKEENRISNTSKLLERIMTGLENRWKKYTVGCKKHNYKCNGNKKNDTGGFRKTNTKLYEVTKWFITCREGRAVREIKNK